MNYILAAITSAGTLSIGSSAAVERNFTVDSWTPSGNGTYYIQLTKNLNSLYSTIIEQYNFDTLVHTYYDGIDYNVTYNDVDEGYIIIVKRNDSLFGKVTEKEDLKIKSVTGYEETTKPNETKSSGSNSVILAAIALIIFLVIIFAIKIIQSN